MLRVTRVCKRNYTCSYGLPVRWRFHCSEYFNQPHPSLHKQFIWHITGSSDLCLLCIFHDPWAFEASTFPSSLFSTTHFVNTTSFISWLAAWPGCSYRLHVYIGELEVHSCVISIWSSGEQCFLRKCTSDHSNVHAAFNFSFSRFSSV